MSHNFFQNFPYICYLVAGLIFLKQLFSSNITLLTDIRALHIWYIGLTMLELQGDTFKNTFVKIFKILKELLPSCCISEKKVEEAPSEYIIETDSIFNRYSR